MAGASVTTADKVLWAGLAVSVALVLGGGALLVARRMAGA